MCWKCRDGTGAVMRVTLLPPPKSLFKQAKLHAPTSIPSGAIPPILGYGGWQLTVALGPPALPKPVSTTGMQQKRGCLPDGDPAPLLCLPGSGGAVSQLAGEEDLGFCLPSSVCRILRSPCLYIVVIYGARDDILRSL